MKWVANFCVAFFIFVGSSQAIADSSSSSKSSHSSIGCSPYYRFHNNHNEDSGSLDRGWHDVAKEMEKITPDKESVISQRVAEMKQTQYDKHAVQFYRPSYVLPYYHSFSVSPWYANHPGSTPDNLPVKNTEVKAQFSLLYPLWTDMFGRPYTLSIAYTQDNFWQLYTSSPYFRETNYEPELFVTYYGLRNWLLSVGIDHQSNGRGGEGYDGMERSWNRAYIDVAFAGENWLVAVRPWVPIFKSSSSDLHNPNITHYMGYGQLLVGVRYHQQQFALTVRNMLESGFSRGTAELTYSFPIYGKLQGYVLLFSGYGQSLIEYDHRTNAIAFGLALSNWM